MEVASTPGGQSYLYISRIYRTRARRSSDSLELHRDRHVPYSSIVLRITTRLGRSRDLNSNQQAMVEADNLGLRRKLMVHGRTVQRPLLLARYTQEYAIMAKLYYGRPGPTTYETLTGSFVASHFRAVSLGLRAQTASTSEKLHSTNHGEKPAWGSAGYRWWGSPGKPSACSKTARLLSCVG